MHKQGERPKSVIFGLSVNYLEVSSNLFSGDENKFDEVEGAASLPSIIRALILLN